MSRKQDRVDFFALFLTEQSKQKLIKVGILSPHNITTYYIRLTFTRDKQKLGLYKRLEALYGSVFEVKTKFFANKNTYVEIPKSFELIVDHNFSSRISPRIQPDFKKEFVLEYKFGYKTHDCRYCYGEEQKNEKSI
ncbi:hypothetical protein MZM54_01595 [[Brevibacterium] frigoritolerans]|nr:hypothetical protein [Peribacillus frigoritolerans]